jgi:hypothetical protein
MPTPPSQPPRPRPGSQSADSRPRRGCPNVPGRPLPDPAAVRLRPVPTSAPPYDDELALPATSAAQLAAWLQQHAATRSTHPDHANSPTPDRTPIDRQPGQASQPSPGHDSRLSPGDHPALASQFAHALIESLAGTRPPRQLSTWTTERTKSRIQRMGPLLTAGHRPHLRRVIAHRPTPDVIEMTLIVTFGPRTRALAVRLEHTVPRRSVPGQPPRPGKWVCTHLEAA